HHRDHLIPVNVSLFVAPYRAKHRADHQAMLVVVALLGALFASARLSLDPPHPLSHVRIAMAFAAETIVERRLDGLARETRAVERAVSLGQKHHAPRHVDPLCVGSADKHRAMLLDLLDGHGIRMAHDLAPEVVARGRKRSAPAGAVMLPNGSRSQWRRWRGQGDRRSRRVANGAGRRAQPDNTGATALTR